MLTFAVYAGIRHMGLLSSFKPMFNDAEVAGGCKDEEVISKRQHCKQQDAPSFVTKHRGSAMKVPPSCHGNCGPSAKALPIGDNTASAFVKTGRELPYTTVADKLSAQKQLQLELYAFMCDDDYSNKQQEVDFNASGKMARYQYRSNQFFGVFSSSSSSNSEDNTSYLLLSSQNAKQLHLHCSASSHAVRAVQSLPADHELEQHRFSHKSNLIGVTQLAMSNKMMDKPDIKMYEHPQLTRWELLYQLTTRCPLHQAMHVTEYESLCNQAVRVKAAAVQPELHHAVQPQKLETSTVRVKMAYHLNTKW